METDTKTFYPQACEDYKVSNSAIRNPTNPVGKGSDNTTYAEICANRSVSYAYWPFDVSVIPEDAVIDSIECKAKAKINSSQYSSASLQLFSGDTAKGSVTTFTSTTETVYSLTTGTWTREELDSIRLKTVIDTNVAKDRYLYFYGADLTVTYTYNSEKFMLKTGGSWTEVARVFKKVNGIWVEQTELSSVVEDGVRYQNGGEIQSTAPVSRTVTITGTGNDTVSYITINGVKYTSAATIEVSSGDVIEATVSAQINSYLENATVSLDGATVLSGGGTYRHTVSQNCTVELYTSGYAVYGRITITS